MQKRSQKLQSLQDKKRNDLKEACACEEEMQKISEEMKERQASFQALSEKAGNCRMAADDLEAEVKDLQAGEERRGSCASQSNGCCFDQPWWSRSSLLGQRDRNSPSKPCKKNVSKDFTRQVEEREEENGKRSKRKEWPANKWVHKSRMVLGTRLQMVRGGDLNTPRNGPKIRESSRSPRRQQQQMQDDESL